MVPMTSVEVLQDLLKFAKDLVPLLSEKKLDTAIAGLAEAKQVVAKQKQIYTEIQASDERLAKAEALEKSNADTRIRVDVEFAGIQASAAALMVREKAVADQEKKLTADANAIAKRQAELEKKEAKIVELLAKTEIDAKEIETAKQAITAKLAKLAEVA